MTEPDKFAIVPIYSDSSGSEVKFPTAIMTGSMSSVMARIKDSKQMRDDLRVSNEANNVRKAKAELKADAAALAADKVAFAESVDAVREVLLNEFVAKLDKLAARLAALEQERANDHEADHNQLPLPPGVAPDPAEGGDGVPLQYGNAPTSYVHSADDGDLQASNPPPPTEHLQEHDDGVGAIPAHVQLPYSGTDPIPNPANLAHPQGNSKAPRAPVAAEDI